MPRFADILALALLLTPGAAAGAPVRDPANRLCATLESCLAAVRDPARPIMHVDSDIDERITRFGAAAVDALVPMLTDPDAEMRTRAGYLLASFTQIDPRHLPALVAAYEAGARWLPRAIAATGSDEALAVLTSAFLRDPSFGSNAQVHMALARFGEVRLRPFVLAQYEGCRTSTNAELCHGLAEILDELPSFPSWALEAMANVARAPSVSQDVRHAIEYKLIERRHPHGLAALVRDLEQVRRELSGPGDGRRESAGDRDNFAWLRIRDAGAYGPAARETAPLLLWFLGREELPDSRAAAALALGLIGDPSAAQALAALEPVYANDWLLAYNSVESLGRLRATEARPLLERVARGHWHGPVRNNAERALNVLSGGAFERPGVPNDGAPFEQSDEEDMTILYSGELRYRGDRHLPAWCAAERGSTVTVEQNPVGGLDFPRRGTRFLSARRPGEREARQLSASRPELARGNITATAPARDGLLVGYARGDEGALFHFDERGGSRELIHDRVGFGFRLGGRLYFVTGSVHAMSTWGAVWEVDPEGPRIVRRIGLPGHAYRASVTSSRAVVLETGEGALAIREDGSLADPSRVGRCSAVL